MVPRDLLKKAAALAALFAAGLVLDWPAVVMRTAAA
jgi:hypothetical protein